MVFQAHFDFDRWSNLIDNAICDTLQKESLHDIENWRSCEPRKLDKSFLWLGQICKMTFKAFEFSDDLSHIIKSWLVKRK